MGWGDEVIKVLRFMMHDENFFWLVFWYGGSFIALVAAVTRLLKSLVPTININTYRSCACHTDETQYTLAEKAED